MGQWATRTRRGGGISINFMCSATHGTSLQLFVEYHNNISAASLTPSNFTSNPSGEQPGGITQISSRQIRLNMSDDVSADTSLTYSGATPGVLSPQTIAIT